jgi:hypothetical protein
VIGAQCEATVRDEMLRDMPPTDSSFAIRSLPGRRQRLWADGVRRAPESYKVMRAQTTAQARLEAAGSRITAVGL